MIDPRWLPALLSLTLLAAGCATTGGSKTEVKLRSDHVEPELVSVRHKVEPGQTLYRIALAYELEVEELMAANGISDPRGLAVGQELFIPGADQVRKVSPPPSVEPGGPKAQGRASPAKTATRPDDRAKEAIAPALKAILSWPLRGVLYGRFGKKGKEAHDGIDLAAPLGTPVKTAAPGSVLYAGTQQGYGNIVIVEHDSGLVTLYAHNKDLRVKTGQKVRAGQVIATVGESGRTSGPHLHFEVRREGLAVDPMPYLGPIPAK